ncbi:hypothetical protein [Photobacterium carnosum]|uniref:hypothetical protein n=1 Tax=Photobacterium carnosum TaxID=2023717 RepID=UPI001E633210|nr:hypothetical protein [Photobacterium carnosum]MCD9498858.1 hypothetical protein [Photobacterium carnosum]
MSFNEYLTEREEQKNQTELEAELNAFLWHQLETEIGHQRQMQTCLRLDNHFGKMAATVYHLDPDGLSRALVHSLAYRLLYALAEAQATYQHNPMHYNAERKLGKIGQHQIGDLYDLTVKDAIGNLTSALQLHGGSIADIASRVIATIKSASEPTQIGMAVSLLGGK